MESILEKKDLVCYDTYCHPINHERQQIEFAAKRERMLNIILSAIEVFNANNDQHPTHVVMHYDNIRLLFLDGGFPGGSYMSQDGKKYICGLSVLGSYEITDDQVHVFKDYNTSS